MRIAHVSDLHVTSPYFVPEWGERVIRELSNLRADIMIITGDLTDNGHPHEHDIAKEFVERMEAKVRIVLPGNHDARNLGYEIFDDLYGTRFPEYQDDRVIVFGIDSTEPDIDDGHVGRENYGLMEDLFSGEERMKILALHHHLIPIPGTGRERQIPVDSGDVLRLCRDLGMDIVLSGHKHLPWVWRLEDTYYITAGTATSRRLKGRSHPSFNVIDVDEKGWVMREFNVSDGAYKEVLRTRSTPSRG